MSLSTPNPCTPPLAPTSGNHINISTEAGSSQGQAATFFRLLYRHEKPPLSWQGIHTTQTDRSATESSISGQRGLPASPTEVIAPGQGGNGGVQGRSLIYLTGVLVLTDTEGYLNGNLSGERTNTQLSSHQIFLLRDNRF